MRAHKGETHCVERRGTKPRPVLEGLISHSGFSPAIVSLPSRKEAYVVESYYSRGVTGTRSDVLTVVDLTDLSTKTEIEIPAKTAALSFRHHIGLLGDERHVVVFNMTPAQSVSIVDVVDRRFVGEIAIPGCAIIMPTGERGFLTLCGDGTLQLVRLDERGAEAARVRTKPFFVVEEDPVFDRVAQTRDGWLLVSHEGLVREVKVDGDRINVGEAWSMLGDEAPSGADRKRDGSSNGDAEETWRPGGAQPFTMHRGSSLLYSFMHKGKVDTQDENGTEIWVFDTERRRRVGRLELPVEASNILSSQESSPHLYVYDKDNKLHIYAGHRLRLERTIEKRASAPACFRRSLNMIDPLVGRAIAMAFALLWLLAAWHKTSAGERFVATLVDYRLLPATWTRPFARLLPLFEAALGLGWLTGLASGWIAPLTSSLLGAYAVAIAINLVRGRVHIGCGCGLGGAGMLLC